MSLARATAVAVLAVLLAGCAADWQTTTFDPRRSCEAFGGRYWESEGTCHSGGQ